VTFNHGVEGSSPSALTNKIGRFLNFLRFAKPAVWALCWQTRYGAAGQSSSSAVVLGSTGFTYRIV
jgi:hypothetical protein